MQALGFLIIVSSPVWMAFFCVYADARRTETARRLWWGAVLIFLSGWAMYGLPDAIYGLPDVGGELFVAGLATLVTLVLAMRAFYVINTERSEEDILLRVAEGTAGKATGEDG